MFYNVKSFIAKYPFMAKFITFLLFIKQRINNQTDKKIEENINTYAVGCSKKRFNRIYRDLLCSKKFYGFTNYKEYFMFGFEKLDYNQRHEYVTTSEYKKIWDTLGIDLENNILFDKYLLYNRIKPYYKRDIVSIRSIQDYPQFVEFVSKHNSFLFKPAKGSLGAGIKLINISNTKNLKQYFLRFIQSGECVLEEIILQAKETACFHKESVNTLRFAMYISDNKTVPIYAMFRMGIGDSVVDNASAGGIAAAVDVNTGKIISNGFTTNGQYYVVHPETNIAIKGYQLPKWDELYSIVTTLTLELKEYKLIGWDMAYTDDGWVVVEGNNRPNIRSIQMCSGYGFRNKMEKMISSSK